MSMDRPVVSCVMITGKDTRRWPFALAAIRSFQQQTFSPSKLELVVVNDSSESLLDHLPKKDSRIREIRVSQRTLGELRNVGLDEAEGDFLSQWDDDDWHHEQLLTTQMRACDGGAVTLSHQVRYSFVSKTAFAYRGQPQKNGRQLGIAGTILHPRTELRYKPDRKHEDSRFLSRWQNAVVINNAKTPHLYLRFYHGSNTWDAAHIMGSFRKQRPWSLAKESADYLRHVLKRQYGDASAGA
jgi:glycosyltransferase involved in cell wall biosynthesis